MESQTEDADDIDGIEVLDQMHADGQGIAVSSRDDDDATPLYENGQLIASHAYYVTDVDPDVATNALP